MSVLRLVFLVLGAAFCALTAASEEQVERFLVEIEIQSDGDLLITETLDVNVEGRQIRRGIFRDLPAFYEDEKTGGKLAYQYSVKRVLRNGEAEPYEILDEGNAKQIRIGRPSVFLPRQRHSYLIEYEIKNQIRYFDTYDELYWNITGNYWNFPIAEAEARIRWPNGAQVLEAIGYTGRLGQSGSAYTYRQLGAEHRFLTTQVLAPGEGLTVSMSVPKGVIDPPSGAERTWLWWARYGSLAILFGSLVGLVSYYYRSFDRVGRDPVKPPVFPRYAPPEGYSPAAVHHIYYRGLRGHKALVSSLMQLGVSGAVDIGVEDKLLGKDVTRLKLKDLPAGVDALPADTLEMAEGFFSDGPEIVLDGEYSSSFNSDYNRFRKRIVRQYGGPYFKWNHAYMVTGAILSILALVVAVNLASFWSVWHTLAIVAIVGFNGVFMYLMPAPTKKGQDIRSQIEGFRLYMEKAEKLQLNAVDVKRDAPPPMTQDRYEAFLPYAVALGVEKPWTDYFEEVLPDIAKSYDPAWARLSRGTSGARGINRAVTGALSSGVASAMPQSSGSSGSGGGGSSGGGGGGGGGGGW